MIYDNFTNLLQGKMFKMFCDLIMVYIHINDLFQTIELSSKERVEKSKDMTEIQLLTTEKEAMPRFDNLQTRRT